MKRFVYLVGAYGCGKTTTVKKIAEKRDDVYPVLEDDSVLKFLSSDKINLRSFFYLSVYHYKLQKAIEESGDKSVILVDGHPMIPLFYLQCFFQMESGMSVSLNDVDYFRRMQFSLRKHCEDFFSKYPQKIIYIKLPFAKHMDMVYDRFEERAKDFSEEADEDYLASLRFVMDGQVRHITEVLYRSDYSEVYNLDDVEKLI